LFSKEFAHGTGNPMALAGPVGPRPAAPGPWAAQVDRSQRADRNAVEARRWNAVDEANALEARLLWADLVPE
jgi:hypothetical protein